MEKLQLKEFSLDNMVSNPHILIGGGRLTGKSTMISYLLEHFLNGNPNIPVSIINPQDKFRSFYCSKFPQASIRYECSEEHIQTLLSDAVAFMTENKNKSKSNGIVILDDCVCYPPENDTKLYELLMNARHYRLTVILASQIPCHLPEELRLNFDYVMVANDKTIISSNKYWNSYFRIFPKLSTFEKCFDTYTKNYQMLVVDNRRPTCDITEKFYWIKAKNESTECENDSTTEELVNVTKFNTLGTLTECTTNDETNSDTDSDSVFKTGDDSDNEVQDLANYSCSCWCPYSCSTVNILGCQNNKSLDSDNELFGISR